MKYTEVLKSLFVPVSVSKVFAEMEDLKRPTCILRCFVILKIICYVDSLTEFT